MNLKPEETSEIDVALTQRSEFALFGPMAPLLWILGPLLLLLIYPRRRARTDGVGGAIFLYRRSDFGRGLAGNPGKDISCRYLYGIDDSGFRPLAVITRSTHLDPRNESRFGIVDDAGSSLVSGFATAASPRVCAKANG